MIELPTKIIRLLRKEHIIHSYEPGWVFEEKIKKGLKYSSYQEIIDTWPGLTGYKVLNFRFIEFIVNYHGYFQIYLDINGVTESE